MTLAPYITRMVASGYSRTDITLRHMLTVHSNEVCALNTHNTSRTWRCGSVFPISQKCNSLTGHRGRQLGFPDHGRANTTRRFVHSVHDLTNEVTTGHPADIYLEERKATSSYGKQTWKLMRKVAP